MCISLPAQPSISNWMSSTSSPSGAWIDRLCCSGLGNPDAVDDSCELIRLGSADPALSPGLDPDANATALPGLLVGGSGRSAVPAPAPFQLGCVAFGTEPGCDPNRIDMAELGGVSPEWIAGWR